MKTICFSAILAVTLIATSCSEKDSLNALQKEAMPYEQFFETVAAMELTTNEEHVVYIDYIYDSHNKTIELVASQEAEPDFFVLDSDKEVASRKKGGSYHVICDLDDKSWESDCDGKFSCGSLIAKCLDAGGCATICKKQMAYAPQTQTFYLLQ